jgi:acyl-CoA synthetase (NDP forming)
LLEAQYKGKIYLIHPFTEQIMGLPCVPSLEFFEEAIQKNELKPNELPDLAILLTSREFLGTILKLGKLGIRNIMIEADLNMERFEGGRTQMLEDLQKQIATYQLQIMGPSMIGIIDFHHNFTSSIIPVRSHIISANRKANFEGGASFLAQSGGLSGACGWWDTPQNLPLAKVIHIGEAIGIKEEAILEYLFLDDLTKIILLFLKDIKPAFITILQKYCTKKPVLYKFVGRNDIIEKEFQQAGAIRVENYIELFEFAKVFLWCPKTTNASIGIIGPSSGAINLIISEMRSQNIHLAKLADENREMILTKIGGSTCKLGNPVDYWPPEEFVGTQICKVYHNASQTLLKDPNVGALFLALEFFTEIEFNFNIFDTIKTKYPNKPIICVLIQAEKEGRERILRIATELKIPVFIDEVERAVKAFRLLLQFSSLQIQNEKY